jgi:hypothetical protein
MYDRGDNVVHHGKSKAGGRGKAYHFVFGDTILFLDIREVVVSHGCGMVKKNRAEKNRS